METSYEKRFEILTEQFLRLEGDYIYFLENYIKGLKVMNARNLKKNDMKVLATLVIGVALMNIFWIHMQIREIGKIKDEYSKYVNEKIILDSDTFTIIDYSILKKTFTLSNGVQVNDSLVIKQLNKN